MERSHYKKKLLHGQQVESGAQVIDVNVDEGMLDSEAVMKEFLNLRSSTLYPRLLLTGRLSRAGASSS